MGRNGILSILILTIPLLLGTAPAAAWVADGSPVCTAVGDQWRPSAVADGAGGQIVAWADARASGSGGTVLELYAQRLDAAGDALWATDGVRLDDTLSGDFSFQVTGDGAGGAIIAWDTSSGGGLAHALVQRLDPAGNQLWTAGGVDLATQAWHPVVVSDGTGGAIVAWRDNRPAFGSSSIYAQRVDAAGTPIWTAGGSLICVSTGAKGRPDMIPDRAGGAVITWEDERELASGGNERVFAQRVNSLGTVQWTTNGVALTQASSQQLTPLIVVDGSVTGGSIVVWRDGRDVTPHLYAQRIGGSGLLAWGVNGAQVSADLNGATLLDVCADGSGGAVASWLTGSFGAYDIVLQRVDSSGAIQWGAAGVPACTADGSQLGRNLLADGGGGVFLGWSDSRDESTTDYDVYVQHFDGAGAARWVADGTPLCAVPDYQSAPWLVTDGAGGLLATWFDARNRTSPTSPNYDLYALPVDPDGLIAPGCDVTPGLLDFGTVAAGGHADLSFVITNTGLGALAGAVTADCPHYSIVAGAGAYVLTSGQSLTVMVRFAPTAVGTHQCTVATGVGPCGDVACVGTADVGAAEAQLASPPTMIARVGIASPPAYGRIRVEGVTAAVGENPAITAELGYGPDGSDPRTDGGWQWVAASFHQDDGDADVYAATVTAATVGTYDYCYRFTFYGVPWLYGDLDGSANGYAPAQAGDLDVVELCASLGTRIYVAAEAAGTGYGTSWPDAVNELTDALAWAELCPAVTEIWVAAGTYRPTAGSDREASFELRDGLAIYGGFAGTEANRGERDWDRNATILSGNIGNAGIATDNSYCVVAASQVSAASVLDGITVAGANLTGAPAGVRSGGIYLGLEASPTLANLTIADNRAQRGAGVLMVSYSSPAMRNLVFADNHATDYGGAMSVGKGCTPAVTGVVFRDNSAGQHGGAVYAAGLSAGPDLVNAVFYRNAAGADGGAFYYNPLFLGSAELTNATFSANTAGGRGGAVFIAGSMSSLVLANDVLWGDEAATGNDELFNQDAAPIVPTHCLMEGCGGSGSGWNSAFGTDGGGNLDQDPQFKGDDPRWDDSLFFWSWSPLIDGGSNALLPAGLTTDVRGEARIAGGSVVDIGAYEHQSGLTGVEDGGPPSPTRVALYQNAPNPFNPQTTIRFDLPRATAVTLRIYDLSGRRVRTLLDGVEMAAGTREMVWDGRDRAGRPVPSGVYFYRFETARWSETRRMSLVK